MPASVHILCGPAGSGKTRALLQRCRAAGAPGTVLWLAPSVRRAEQVRALVGATTEQTDGEAQRRRGCVSTLIRTFQDFADEVVAANDPAARPLSRVQRRLLVDEVVADLHGRGNLGHFARVLDTRGFGEGLLALLEELKSQEIWPGQFARAAYRRSEDGSLEQPRTSRGIHAKDRQLARLYARYQQYLALGRLLDPEGRLWRARDLLTAGSCRPSDQVRAVFVDDFVDLSPTQHDILDALCCGGAELWLSLLDEPDEERAELFTVARATLLRLQRLNPQFEYLPSRGGILPSPLGGEGSGVRGLLFLPSPLGGEGLGVRGEEEKTPHPQPLSPQGRGEQERRPVGLAHLERHLFRPLRSSHPAADAEGIQVIQAPGMLGEARLVARQIKTLLSQGTAAEDVLVTMRDVLPYADLVREVFGDYGIPVDVEGTEPLTRSPVVALLLKALRLPEDDWPFAGLTALLRSSYFRPQWPEARFDAEVPQLAEALLRLLGEPRGREAYLEAVRRWADRQQPGLEDEQAQESRRRRTHELAKTCGPFLERLFRAWDGMPSLAPVAEHAAWVRNFAEDVGLDRAALENRGDAAAWQRFWEEVGHWCGRGAGRWPAVPRQASGLPHDRKTFLRRLGALAAEGGVARTPRGPGRVRVLSAPLARHLDAEYVFVMGLGERSFPRLAVPAPLLDEQERQAFRQAGLNLPGVAELLPEEMLLFYQVVTRARRQLTLSYAAVDERGQDLLPSSFLTAVLDCFVPGAVPVQRRSMLIEGYDSDDPLSPAEHRVRAAVLAGKEATAADFTRAGLPAELASNLAAAAEVVRCRFHHGDYTPYDGLFRDAAVIGELRHLFGPEKVFSPTALEDYVACPFRFFLGHVLRLEPLEEPSEGIEVTRRGQAVHRALSRLHKQLRAAGLHQPAGDIDAHVLEHFREAVAEDVARAPGAASKALWTLEGQRLLRVAARYRAQWQDFVKPWGPLQVKPEPFFFEVDFGLPAEETSGEELVFPEPLVIRGDGIEVRVSGRIDRVDVVRLGEEVGFWIIDYKTGRTEHYTSKALVEFQRLQLTLYALAVEEVLLAGRQARPLGLAYWLVAGDGPKVVLPVRNQVLWFQESERWRQVRRQLQDWVVTLVANIRGGVYPLKPRSETCTQTCPYGQICRISQSRHVDKSWSLPLPQITEPERSPTDG